jgi:hypothetical protein
MLGHALRTALTGKAEHFAEARFGFLELPFLPDWRAAAFRFPASAGGAGVLHGVPPF